MTDDLPHPSYEVLRSAPSWNQDDYLRCTHDQRVPADNDGSERDIRMIKLRQKVGRR